MEAIEIHEGDKGINFFALKIDDREAGRMMVDINEACCGPGTQVSIYHSDAMDMVKNW